MKKNTYSIKNRQGVTLIELTVVIAILLVLISVLFVGASYYKTNADQAACVVNQSSTQKAFRSYQNLSSDTSPTLAEAVTAGAMTAIPVCPSTQTAYTLTGEIVGCADATDGAAHNAAAGDKTAW
ncbi:type II secretion system protein [Rubritalea marina]|uniref:type II secretion system protein n=1 Tax=Rubritalea marina TaxID=361055 RepID=UPI00037E4FC4|nr:prepilin-type N-terminal cleavage/methylation domain-containing protein [Rubritalea marina]